MSKITNDNNPVRHIATVGVKGLIIYLLK